MRLTRAVALAPSILFCLAADAGASIYGLVKGDPGIVLEPDRASGAPSPWIYFNRITATGDPDIRNGTLFASGLYSASPGPGSVHWYGLALLPPTEHAISIPLSWKALLAYSWPPAFQPAGVGEPGDGARPPAAALVSAPSRPADRRAASVNGAGETSPVIERPTVAFALGGLAVLLGWRRSRSRPR